MELNRKHLRYYSCVAIIFYGCQKDPGLVPSDLEVLAPAKKIDVFLKNLEIPWGMAFLPNGDFVLCERAGRISLKHPDSDQADLVMTRSVSTDEGGLLGLAVDPDFAINGYLFIYETVDSTNRIVRLRLLGGKVTEDKPILSGIPGARWHNGGALKFAPDGYLYVGTGDAVKPMLSQDLSSLAGKILRIDRNGGSAPGNPFGNEIWSYGHRNVQGFDWNKNGVMVATEHGPSSEFGWCCHDEINRIEPGKNYGWPLVLPGEETDTLALSLYNSGMDTWAPSGGSFIEGKEWGRWDGNFILAGLRGKRLVRFVLNADASVVVEKSDTLKGKYLRLRNIIQAPDGSILFSSANTDRSDPQPLVGDDKIYRMYLE